MDLDSVIPSASASRSSSLCPFTVHPSQFVKVSRRSAMPVRFNLWVSMAGS